MHRVFMPPLAKELMTGRLVDANARYAGQLASTHQSCVATTFRQQYVHFTAVQRYETRSLAQGHLELISLEAYSRKLDILNRGFGGWNSDG